MSRDDKDKSSEDRHPWRDNIEAITMAIVMAVFLKYFIVEAYRIPTGSMQPTLMGLTTEKGGIFDRILVDKLSYHFRDPARFEVAVFRYPLDRSKNFIKRIWGLPGEELEIRNGDVFRRDDTSSEWENVRRPRPVQDEMLKKLETGGEWKTEGPWEEAPERLVARSAGSATFPRTRNSIRDNYTDGYPRNIASKVRRRGTGSGDNDVGDLRVAGEVSAEASCEAFEIELTEGSKRYTFRIPGPAAAPDARPAIHVRDLSDASLDSTVEATEGAPLRAGSATEFLVQNIDDRLELELDGDVLVTLDIDAATRQASRVRLQLTGGGATLEGLGVFRDVFYTTAHATMSSWSIPDDSYVMLGDNTQDSADSREWQLARFQLSAPGEAAASSLEGPSGDATILRGNLRGRNENPHKVTGGPDGTEVFFRDEWGERHHFLANESRTLAPERTPFVPRELITGRALLVFWPLMPTESIYRLQWIR